MKISVITATFNSGATLRDTLESVLLQTHNDIEYIIVDGKSKDNTLDIVREYEPRFRDRMRWISEPDKGIYDAMNKGISMATGDVIGILNSDDFYASSDILSIIAQKIEDVDVVYGDLDFVDCIKTQRVVRQWRGSQYTPGSFLKGWHPAPPTFYVRRKYFDKLGGFDTSLDVSADFELMLRFIEKNRLSNKYVPLTFIKMRLGGESTGSLSKIIKGNKNILCAFKKNGYSVTPLYFIYRLLPKALNIIKNKLQI